MYASNNLDTVVERNAHKWAADPSVSVLCVHRRCVAVLAVHTVCQGLPNVTVVVCLFGRIVSCVVRWAQANWQIFNQWAASMVCQELGIMRAANPRLCTPSADLGMRALSGVRLAS